MFKAKYIPLKLKLSNDFDYVIGPLRKDFIEKISKISTGEHIKPNYTPSNLTNFQPITLDETLKLISSSPNKSCDLDPCPTFIVKECKDVLAPPIMQIINLSLSEGIFPGRFKQALVTPLLKKPSLPKTYSKTTGLFQT